jgi:hypothetical protein
LDGLFDQDHNSFTYSDDTYAEHPSDRTDGTETKSVTTYAGNEAKRSPEDININSKVSAKDYNVFTTLMTV